MNYLLYPKRVNKKGEEITLNYFYFSFFKKLGYQLFSYHLNDEFIDSPFIIEASGILLPGGGDLDPYLYSDQISSPHLLINVFENEIDLRLAKIGMERRMKIIGICKGAQIINVLKGGNLFQDIKKHSHTFHTVSDEDSNFHIVNSYHHQAINKLGDGLKVSYMALDSVIEGIRGENILAYQFHPERLENKRFQDEVRVFLKDK